MMEAYIRSLTDKARLKKALQEQRIRENYKAFLRAIENGEELD